MFLKCIKKESASGAAGQVTTPSESQCIQDTPVTPSRNGSGVVQVISQPVCTVSVCVCPVLALTTARIVINVQHMVQPTEKAPDHGWADARRRGEKCGKRV